MNLANTALKCDNSLPNFIHASIRMTLVPVNLITTPASKRVAIDQHHNPTIKPDNQNKLDRWRKCFCA